jgi:hypothetical protein
LNGAQRLNGLNGHLLINEALRAENTLSWERINEVAATWRGPTLEPSLEARSGMVLQAVLQRIQLGRISNEHLKMNEAVRPTNPFPGWMPGVIS